VTAPILWTKFTSTEPLAKVIGKGPDGEIVKTASAQMYKGTFETVRVEVTPPGTGTAQRIVDQLVRHEPTQALSPSLSLGADSGSIVTVKNLRKNPGAAARDKPHFGYRPGPLGLLVVDYDPVKGTAPLTRQELWEALLTVWPEAADGIVIHWVSGSSLIYDGERQITPVAGQRLYIVVTQELIPAILLTLNKRARLLGIGSHVKITSRGVRLIGSLFDQAMGDGGGRMDFAPAGAVCRDGLKQRRGPPTILADGFPLGPPTPPLATEEAELKALDEAAKQRAEPEALAKSAAWLAANQQSAAIEAITDGKDPDEARERVKREHNALLGGVLMGGAVLIHVDAEGNETAITVDQLLADPKRWHMKHFLSPHEPDHRGRSPDAIAYLLQAQPVIFDLNDCITYRLQRQPASFQVVQGNRAAVADQIATELSRYSDLMTCAGQLVRVVDGAFLPVSRPMLGFVVGTRIALFRQTKEGKATAIDPDQQTLDMVHAILTERARKVQGRSSIPLIDPNGRVIDQPGLDDPTGIFLEIDQSSEAAEFAEKPTRLQVVEALRRAWRPWSLYDWATPHDKAAMLATPLTVPLRPTIKNAPGTAVDGLAAGSGKSSAVEATMTLSQGHTGNMKSWTNDSEVEIEKYLLSLAKAGASVVAWDNILGVFDSATISSTITQGMVSARQLGVTQALSPSFQAMFLASGNQMALAKDCGTRFLQARIGGGDGKPHRKSFPFEPGEAARSDRQGIVRAIITIHLAWHAAGAPQCADGIATRFASWGRTIRPIVHWLHSSGIAEEAGLGPLGDPADSILNRESQSDPDTENSVALVAAIHKKFDGDPFSARELSILVRIERESNSSLGRELWDAVSSFFPRASNAPTVQGITALLRNRRERVYAGLRLAMLPKVAGREGERAGQLFRVSEA
jgi:hypothetical protein